MHNTPKPRRQGVRCTTTALVCTALTCGVQENAAIGLVVLQSAEILHIFRVTFLMRDYCIIHLSLGEQG